MGKLVLSVLFMLIMLALLISSVNWAWGKWSNGEIGIIASVAVLISVLVMWGAIRRVLIAWIEYQTDS